MIIWWSSYEDKPPSLLLSVRSWDKCGSAQPWTLLPRALCKSISLQCRLKLEGFSSVSHNALWKFTHALLSADICSSGPSPPHLHWTLAKISSMRCFIMHLVLNIARQFVERKILNQFAVIQCSTYSDPPSLPRRKPFCVNPLICEEVQCKKGGVATKMQCSTWCNAVHCRPPLVGTKTRNLEKPRKDFCRNWKLVLALRSRLHVSPTLIFPTKCLFGINCLTLTLLLGGHLLTFDHWNWIWPWMEERGKITKWKMWVVHLW